jgi:hypothetical protein
MGRACYAEESPALMELSLAKPAGLGDAKRTWHRFALPAYFFFASADIGMDVIPSTTQVAATVVN